MFVPGWPFHDSLMFVGKARSLPCSGAPERCFALVSSYLTCKHWTILERPARASTLTYSKKIIKYGRKKFYNIGPWCEWCWFDEGHLVERLWSFFIRQWYLNDSQRLSVCSLPLIPDSYWLEYLKVHIYKARPKYQTRLRRLTRHKHSNLIVLGISDKEVSRSWNFFLIKDTIIIAQDCLSASCHIDLFLPGLSTSKCILMKYYTRLRRLGRNKHSSLFA